MKKKILRRFSTAFKKEKVELIESGKVSVIELSRIYEVSTTSIYNWIRKYSKHGSNERVVVEKISEEQKNIELLQRVRDLEQALGRKQLELDYYKSIVEVIKEEEGEDVEKKYKHGL